MMYEKRPTAAKGNRGQNVKTTIRRADGSTWDFPIDNPNPLEIAKAITRKKLRAAARSGLTDNPPRTTKSIRERMARALAARERKLGLSIQSSDVGLTHTALPGGWTLDIQ